MLCMGLFLHLYGYEHSSVLAVSGLPPAHPFLTLVLVLVLPTAMPDHGKRSCLVMEREW